MAVLRRNAVFITLPIAGVVGFIGYHFESLISDKYTPYNSKQQHYQNRKSSSNPYPFPESIQDHRAERLTEDLDHPENVAKLQLKENVLERNLSPSLKSKQNVQSYSGLVDAINQHFKVLICERYHCILTLVSYLFNKSVLKHFDQFFVWEQGLSGPITAAFGY